MANTIRTINWTEHKIIHSSITQALRSVQTFYDVGQKKSLRGTILYCVKFFFLFVTFTNPHFPRLIKEDFSCLPRVLQGRTKGGISIFRASTAKLFSCPLCNNFSKSSSYLCMPCSVYQKMATFVRQAGQQDNLPSCPPWQNKILKEREK